MYQSYGWPHIHCYFHDVKVACFRLLGPWSVLSIHIGNLSVIRILFTIGCFDQYGVVTKFAQVAMRLWAPFLYAVHAHLVSNDLSARVGCTNRFCRCMRSHERHARTRFTCQWHSSSFHTHKPSAE